MTANEFVEYCKWLGQEDRSLNYKEIVHKVMEMTQNIETINRPDTCYLETHYVISSFLDRNEDSIESLTKIQYEQGTGAMWDFAQQLTTEFIETYEGVEWGEELDWNDTLEEFLNKKVK